MLFDQESRSAVVIGKRDRRVDAQHFVKRRVNVPGKDRAPDDDAQASGLRSPAFYLSGKILQIDLRQTDVFFVDRVRDKQVAVVNDRVWILPAVEL